MCFRSGIFYDYLRGDGFRPCFPHDLLVRFFFSRELIPFLPFLCGSFVWFLGILEPTFEFTSFAGRLRVVPFFEGPQKFFPGDRSLRSLIAEVTEFPVTFAPKSSCFSSPNQPFLEKTPILFILQLFSAFFLRRGLPCERRTLALVSFFFDVLRNNPFLDSVSGFRAFVGGAFFGLFSFSPLLYQGC